MWNDEDNNPYGSFDRRNSSDIPNISSQDHRKQSDHVQAVAVQDVWGVFC